MNATQKRRLSPSNNHNQQRLKWSDRASRNTAFCAIVALVCSFGCSKSDRPKTVPVTGTVTFDGGVPEQSGGLFFAPLEVEEGYPRRGGRALFDTDGKFAATSFDDGDGLVPGTYRVRVESWKEPPGMGKPGVSYVPNGFEAPDVVVSSEQRSVSYDVDVVAP